MLRSASRLLDAIAGTPVDIRKMQDVPGLRKAEDRFGGSGPVDDG
jgi:hypothetical protein